MKKILTVTLAAVLASSSMGIATAASAQSREYRQDRNDRRDDRRDDRQDRREDRREDRADRRDDRRDYRQDQRAYARWQQAERRYNAGRYQRPRGYVDRQWSYGQRLPANYRTRGYVVNDYSRYGLRAPPRGYQYTRVNNDVVLTAVATGLITAVIVGLFN